MANICTVNIQVLGHEKDIEDFVKALNQEENIWIGRGMISQIQKFEKIRHRNNVGIAEVFGDTKWSVQSSLIDNAHSMQKQKETGKGPWGDIKQGENCEYIDLMEASKLFDVVIEVYSEEAGCEFAEHMAFANGKQLIDDVLDYQEIDLSYWRDFEEESKESVEQMFNIEITDAEWESDEPFIYRGGFESQDFPFINEFREKIEKEQDDKFAHLKEREPYNVSRSAQEVSKSQEKKDNQIETNKER